MSEGKEGYTFGLAAVLVFLFLAALYGSWTLPFSVILAVPLGIFGALFGIFLRKYDYDVYTQIGIVTLIGLAAKNAILIVEMAKLRHEEGKPIREAALEAAQLRLRPILMTSFAFNLGVLPLVIATGAGAAARRGLGITVFSGIIAATLLAVFVVLVLYVLVNRWVATRPETKEVPAVPEPGPREAVIDATQRCCSQFSLSLSSVCWLCGRPELQERPDAQVPAQYCSSGQVAAPTDKNSLADLAWTDLFRDETITNLVQTALRQSFDLQAATDRVLEARDQLGIARSQLAPHLDASASFTVARTSTVGALDGIVPATTNFAASYTQAGLNLGHAPTIVPFPTAVLAAYVNTSQAMAAAVYIGTYLVIAILFYVLWFYASRGGRLLLRSHDRERIAAISRHGNTCLATTVFGCLSARFRERLGQRRDVRGAAIFFALPGVSTKSAAEALVHSGGRSRRTQQNQAGAPETSGDTAIGN